MSKAIFYWSLIGTGFFILELWKLWADSQCGLIQMSCKHTMLLPIWVWLGYISFGFGLLVASLFSKKEGHHED